MSAATGKNALANLAGNLVGPLLALVMTPFYLRKIGLEGLGLIGLMTFITTVLGIFVAGVSKSYQRDIATAQSLTPEDLPGLVKGGMLMFAGLGTLLGLVVLIFGHGQMREMAEGTQFSQETVDRCLLLISCLLALGITSGGLISTLVALRDQVWPNTLGIITAILTAAATWFALTTWTRVDVFYLCQLGGTILAVLFLSLRCRSILAKSGNGKKRCGIREAWRKKIQVSGKLSLILIIHEGLGVMITQIDRLLVTSNFPLASLGAYNLGANPSRLAGVFTNPIVTVTYPEMCRLAGGNFSRQVIGDYLGRVIFLLVLMLGAAIIVVVPSAHALLALWLGASNVPAEAATCLTILTLAQLVLSVAGPFYNLTVAFGRVGYGIPKNLLSLLILPVLGFFLVKKWGLPGAAVVWLLYACASNLVCAWFAYHRHADIKSSIRWITGGMAVLISAGGIAWLLTEDGFQGLAMIAISAAIAVVFIFAFLVYFFGLNLGGWLQILDVDSLSGRQKYVSPIVQGIN